jgi:hypothetical protein
LSYEIDRTSDVVATFRQGFHEKRKEEETLKNPGLKKRVVVTRIHITSQVTSIEAAHHGKYDQR